MTDDTRTVQRTFSVAVPVERAWRAMTDPKEMEQWFFAFTPAIEFDVFGVPATIEVLEVDHHHRLRYAEQGGPVQTVHGRAEVTVTFEDIDAGTRITITRSGFGDGADWDAAIESTSRGLEESIADFVLYVEGGVSYPRHQRQPCSPGVLGTDARGGLLVQSVTPESFAHRLGLRPGDVLVELGGAAVFGHRELLFFARSHQPGDVGEAAWVRAGTLLRGKAELLGWQPPKP
jgi:uncharacterized protein YndB with AHSA1/START domain